MSFITDFDDLLEPVTIGTFSDGIDEDGDPIATWTTVYETFGYFNVLNGRLYRVADANQRKQQYRIYLPPNISINGNYRIYRTADFDWETHKREPYYTPVAEEEQNDYYTWVDAEKVSE